jgi:hypothetical protein
VCQRDRALYPLIARGNISLRRVMRGRRRSRSLIYFHWGRAIRSLLGQRRCSDTATRVVRFHRCSTQSCSLPEPRPAVPGPGSRRVMHCAPIPCSGRDPRYIVVRGPSPRTIRMCDRSCGDTWLRFAVVSGGGREGLEREGAPRRGGGLGAKGGRHEKAATQR